LWISANSLFDDSIVDSRSRPLMIIMNRSSDLFPILQHNSTYQALISELLDFKLNRVTVEILEKGNLSMKKKIYDLNTQNDAFLSQYASSPFPEAVDANEKELADVKNLRHFFFILSFSFLFRPGVISCSQLRVSSCVF
jgi:hypothetical protein